MNAAVSILILLAAVGFLSFAAWYLWNSVRQVPQNIRLAVMMGGQYAGSRGPGFTIVLKWLETAKEVPVSSEGFEVFEAKESIKFADALAPVHLEAWLQPRDDYDGIYAVAFHWKDWKAWAEGEVASRARGFFAGKLLADAQAMKGDILAAMVQANSDIVIVLDAGGVIISKLLLEDIDEPPELAAATQKAAEAKLILISAASEAQKRAVLLAEMVKYLTDPANVNPPMSQADAIAFATMQVNRMTSADAKSLVDVYAQGGDLSALLAQFVAAARGAAVP